MILKLVLVLLTFAVCNLRATSDDQESTTMLYDPNVIDVNDTEPLSSSVEQDDTPGRAGIDSLLFLAHNKIYYLRNQKVPYWRAVQNCIDEGKRIASIDNRVQQSDLVNMLRNSHEIYWVAGVDLGHEGSWVWINKHVKIMEQFWAANQPDNFYGAEHCLAINEFGSALWNDQNCDVTLYNYICEINV
ncbi:galactose-specific lectin nattectin-like [Malaya genurostris]|uniref:galactose-specific lectin nattectin-like n=1 Tax=Malaya genurostris TaxID=325434 RepID=UPI0026F3B279|nr:galactose-specific lectin nattectin-like [Malaya genurostris]